MIKGLIFDFDGLILDTETPEYEAWRVVFAEHDCPPLPLELWVDNIGRGHDQERLDPYACLEEHLGRSVDREVVRSRRRALFAELIACEPVRPGITEYLRDAKRLGLRLAVASSSKRDWVEGHLARMGLLSFFDATRCADDVPRTKPDPALYISALAALGLIHREAIAFEDAPHGVTAAQSAGLYCVAVPNAMTAHLSLGHADRHLHSMADVSLDNVLAQAQNALDSATPAPGIPSP